MSKIGHQPCPSCPSSDAYYMYPDGHGHCYSCGYHSHGTSIASMKSKLAIDNYSYPNSIKGVITDDYTYNLPIIAKSWLKKYDITDEEIKRNRIMWNKKEQSLAFPVCTKGSSIDMTNERYFGNDPQHPKYITKGNKNTAIRVISAMKFVGYTEFVLVEDYVSAIKVARKYNSIPLFGTFVPMELGISIINTVGRTVSVFIWLDPDKKQESLYQWMKLSQFIPNTFVILSCKDPKYYSEKEIQSFIEKAKDAGTNKTYRNLIEDLRSNSEDIKEPT